MYKIIVETIILSSIWCIFGLIGIKYVNQYDYCFEKKTYYQNIYEKNEGMKSFQGYVKRVSDTEEDCHNAQVILDKDNMCQFHIVSHDGDLNRGIGLTQNVKEQLNVSLGEKICVLDSNGKVFDEGKVTTIYEPIVCDVMPNTDYKCGYIVLRNQKIKNNEEIVFTNISFTNQKDDGAQKTYCGKERFVYFIKVILRKQYKMDAILLGMLLLLLILYVLVDEFQTVQGEKRDFMIFRRLGKPKKKILSQKAGNRIIKRIVTFGVSYIASIIILEKMYGQFVSKSWIIICIVILTLLIVIDIFEMMILFIVEEKRVKNGKCSC